MLQRAMWLMSGSISIPRALGLCLACGAMLLTGCDDGRPPRVPVSGRVLIDGKPLEEGFICFVPKNSRPSGGPIDRYGRFRLSCFEKNDGAVLGRHKVSVISYEQFSEDEVGWNVPRRYAEFSTSGLEEVIDGPTDSLEINLTWGDDVPLLEVHPSDE